MTPDQLAAATGARPDVAARWLAPIQAAMQRWGISTPARQAAFLAQIGVESAHLSAVVENLNYSAEALVRTWPARFTPDLAQRLGRTADHPANQEGIANVAYARRFGNGDEASGDGWRYRGRGLVQVTFRANYRACGVGLALDLVTHPELLEQPEGAASAAGWFWQTHGCNQLADTRDVHGISLRINGGTNGLEERVALWTQAKEALHA